MMVTMEVGSSFSAWREKARALLAAGIPPEQLLWEEGGGGLFEEAEMPVIPAAAVFKVPASFVSFARGVSCCADERRWALLYRLLWRMMRDGERNLLEIASDPDVALAREFTKKVRREIHKMHAFVRFRKLGEDEEGREKYAAWFEPDHWIVKAAVPFFRDRFAQMDWSIFTPKGSAHWIGGELGFSPGLRRDPCDRPDLLEDAWKTYYRSIFNPARWKVKMMRSEMPERYWKNMPEAELIPELIRESRTRVQGMFEEPVRGVKKIRGNAYLDALVNREKPLEKGLSSMDETSLEELGEMVKRCRFCPLWERATCAVFGAGPQNARLMIVGEQPGDREDLVGLPFVGPAGQLLDRALMQAGIDRSSAYLTNAVKHFKWESKGKQQHRLHRSPDRGEIEACRPWVLAEIAKIQPEVVILLGNTAGRSLLGEGVSVGKHRGVVEGTNLARKVVFTVHPSFILRQTDADKKSEEYLRFVEDLRLAANEKLS